MNCSPQKWITYHVQLKAEFVHEMHSTVEQIFFKFERQLLKLSNFSSNFKENFQKL